MKELIDIIRNELYAKPFPGKILNDLMDEQLKKISKDFECDQDALWIGAYLADSMITEAIETGNIKLHMDMAVERAYEVFEKHPEITDKQKEIILEIISCHHGKPHTHIETQLFINADAFRFLYPRGVFQFFGSQHEGKEENFDKAIQYAIYKLKEKYALVDLNDELKAEAKELYDRWMWIFERVGVKEEVPELY